MPYCSIEEAWGSSFSNPEQTSSEKYTHLESAFTPMTELDRKENPKRKIYSRDMSRLPNHNGSINRYTENKNIHKVRYTNNINTNKFPQQDVSLDDGTNYLNLDTPLNAYSKNSQNKLLKNQIKNCMNSDVENALDDYNQIIDENNYSRISEESDNEEDEDDIVEVDNIIAETDNESESRNESINSFDGSSASSFNSYKNRKKINKTLDYLLNNKNNNGKNNNNNFYDILIYIVTGVFIIFILDIFTKLGKNGNL